MRVILGILKGGVVGGLVGYAASMLGLGQGALAYALYAVIGFLTGVVCGRPIWRQETLWIPAVKGVFGALVCAGLYWVASRFLGGIPAPAIPLLGVVGGVPAAAVPVITGPVIAIAYGVFVELDDGGASEGEGKGKDKLKGKLDDSGGGGGVRA